MINSAQLKKINELVKTKGDLDNLLIHGDLLQWEAVKPFIIRYQDLVKAELKELGYEE